ncbi:hypothetical protein ACLB2K_062848 [Fragaria x ananassa]
MSTVATPKNVSDNLSFFWLPTDPNAEYYVYMHFAEVVELQANQSRQLDITWNGEHYAGPFVPNFFYTTTVSSTKALTGGNYKFSISNPDGNSVLQPILNGIEIYQLIKFPQLETKQDDISCWRLKRKKEDGATIYKKPRFGSLELEQKNRQFTYSELLKFINNFERTLGKGGFGTVYHGYIEKTQVAVKMLSSVQGFQEFQAEVSLLMRVHHTNLTSLVGYCNDENSVGLVYEYIANGNLHSSSNILGWEDRLRIAADAAQGLEHYGCKPPIVHRDVKSANILLTENFLAKASDFGLSRNFPTDGGTHISTVVAGTPGYLDPEYYRTSRLNEKSDAYSFGIVLLEIITSRPVITGAVERIHICQWVGFMLGDINSIVDPRLERNFSVNSVWKVVEIAMACVSRRDQKANDESGTNGAEGVFGSRRTSSQKAADRI